MNTCLVSYDAVLSSEVAHLRGEAVYREWRMPDAFGAPGKLVRRELLYVKVNGVKYEGRQPTIHCRTVRIMSETPTRGISWEIADCGD